MHNNLFEREEKVDILFQERARKPNNTVICFNGAGMYVAPLFIFPRPGRNTDLLEGAPRETGMSYLPCELIEAEIFGPIWFEVLLKPVKPIQDD
jgi:hypothetical protein